MTVNGWCAGGMGGEWGDGERRLSKRSPAFSVTTEDGSLFQLISQPSPLSRSSFRSEPKVLADLFFSGRETPLSRQKADGGGDGTYHLGQHSLPCGHRSLTSLTVLN